MGVEEEQTREIRDGEDICEMEDWRRGILILSSSS